MRDCDLEGRRRWYYDIGLFKNIPSSTISPALESSAAVSRRGPTRRRAIVVAAGGENIARVGSSDLFPHEDLSRCEEIAFRRREAFSDEREETEADCFEEMQRVGSGADVEMRMRVVRGARHRS